MNNTKYHQLKVIVILFIFIIVVLSVSLNSYLLAITGVSTGFIFNTLVRSRAKIKIDEREITVREKAAQITYSIFTPTIGIGSFLILLLASGILPPVKNELYYLESLGVLLAYLTLFLIVLYAISYYFLSRKYGGSHNE